MSADRASSAAAGSERSSCVSARSEKRATAGDGNDSRADMSQPEQPPHGITVAGKTAKQLRKQLMAHLRTLGRSGGATSETRSDAVDG